MLKRLTLAAALAAGLASPALAQQQYGGVTLYDLRGQPLGTSSNPVYVSGAGGGSAGSTGTVGSAGTNGTVAQSVQGIVGGVPLNGFVGQYNSTLPTFSSAQVGYLAVDANGRLILSPTTAVSVNGTYNATQPTLTNGQTAGLQLDASGNLRVVDNSAVIADQGAVTTAAPSYSNGTNAALSLTTAGALRTDASATTQPVSAASLPLPSGAATSANQSSEITQLTTANQRASYFQDFNSTAAGASATIAGASHDLGASPSQWSWVSFNGQATVTGGTFFLQASTDNFASSTITVATVAVTTASASTGSSAVVPYTISDRVRYRYYRIAYTNGTTAGAVTGALTASVN